MVNRTWLVTVGILSGLVIGASTVKADTDTNVNSEATSAVVTNINTQNTDKVPSVSSNNDQQTVNSVTPTNQSNEQQEQQADTQAVTNGNEANGITVSTPKATYYYPNQWYGTKNSDGTTTWTYTKSDGTRAEYEWQWINGSWYYFEPNGDMAANGWHGDNHGDDYYFDANGHYETNCWHAYYSKYNGTTWTYSKSDGTKANYEWLWINGAWYYFQANGEMAANGWESDNHGNDYYFDANGHYETNCWHAYYSKYNGTTWTYSKSDGTKANYEWLWINGAWYYFQANGEMAANGWESDNHGNDYYFDANGHYETNCWHAYYSKYNGTTWTYSKSDGTKANYEWLWINGAWYYFQANGEMAANGWHYDNYGDQYYFDANGHYAY